MKELRGPENDMVEWSIDRSEIPGSVLNFQVTGASIYAVIAAAADLVAKSDGVSAQARALS
jgi:hypothetical protein